MIDKESCATLYGTSWILNYILLAAMFVRVLRLLLIYNLNRQRLLENTEPKVIKQMM